MDVGALVVRWRGSRDRDAAQ
eukprot:COSAG03_NODE_26874_length_256_cov_0.993631_1_plen_20_part_10